MNREVAIDGARQRLDRARTNKREARRLRNQAVRELRDLENFCKKHRIEFVLEEKGEVVRSVTPPPRVDEDGNIRTSGIAVVLEQ